MVDVEKIVREYINKTVHMSLATVADDKPWVCEVHFAYDDDLNLYWRSKKSRRHSEEIAKNPNVAGNIVKQHELDEYPHAIYFEGTAELLAEEAKETVAELFVARLGVEKEAIIANDREEEGHKFYKITVKNWYAFGKFGEESGAKYTLKWNA